MSVGGRVRAQDHSCRQPVGKCPGARATKSGERSTGRLAASDLKQKPRVLANRGAGVRTQPMPVPTADHSRRPSRLVAGRSSGFRLLSKPSRQIRRSFRTGTTFGLPGSVLKTSRRTFPSRFRIATVAFAAVVAGYSGASAADSHGLPCWPRLRPGHLQRGTLYHTAAPCQRPIEENGARRENRAARRCLRGSCAVRELF